MRLPGAFANLPFSEPARARVNLERLRGCLPESLFSLLPTVLAQVPDPDGSLNYLERFSREAGKRVLAAVARQPTRLHYLLALFSHSRFLSETLILQPGLIDWLGREKNLERLKSKEELLEEYARFESTALDLEPALALARFKRRQYLRITLKDILGISTLVETTLELSTLADVLLEEALRTAEVELQRHTGAPQTRDPLGRRVRARFAVISLGKLGGNELNYSSDIDLLFLYDGEGHTSAPQLGPGISNNEYFIRLAQRLLQTIAGVTSEGAVFRVDMRLRPRGGEGDLALSLPAAVHYYQRRAREWEWQMLLKARHSAGDAGLVREFLAAVEPFLYRGPMHFGAVESVLAARGEFDRKLDAQRADRLNVKLAPGGIRDIEFFVQCLQRLYGQQDPWVRATGTLVGLHKLYEKGYLAGHDHFRLAGAYQFLRQVEHRLQLEQGQQTHVLPQEREALGLLARRCGVRGSAECPAEEEFRRLLEEHLEAVRAIYERTLPVAGGRAPGEEFALRAPERIGPPGELSLGQLVSRLRAQSTPLARALESVEISARARQPFHRFLSAALASSTTFEQVNRAAAALPRALEVLRLSEPLGALLVRQPERLAQLLTVAGEALHGESGQLEANWAQSRNETLPAELRLLVEQPGSLTQQMAGLRRYYVEAVFGWGARELCQQQPVEEGVRRYAALAEDILRAGLAVTEQQCGEATSPGFAVIALGRLGTDEMDLGSDADLVFVAADPEAQARGQRVAEKLLHVVSAYTRDGTIFPVDLRLRSRGSEGELVQTGESILDYFATAAETWEAATYLKARPVAGDLEFGWRWCECLREVLRSRFSGWERIRVGLAEMRRRLENEGATTPVSANNFETGEGGAYDLDFILCGAALRAGARSLAGLPWLRQLALLRVETGLTGEEQSALQAAARFMRAVDHAIRLVTGRSVPRLPTGRRAELVAELTGGWLEESLEPAGLAHRLEETRRSVRRLFLRVFR
ncbi:MAG: hypothetical protein ACE5IP_10420 [Terriglobia bacterium]